MVTELRAYLSYFGGPLFAIFLAVDTFAATYTDSQNLVSLTVTQVTSTADGFIAWRFGVAPVSNEHEIGSIDAASGSLGFVGEAFRQVNPFGLPTVFTDLNPSFGEGEDSTTDTQFLFESSGLILAPSSAAESLTNLEAAFTGFAPIGADTGPVDFAQVVMPINGGGMFQVAFAVRPLGGGVPEIASLGPIEFGLLTSGLLPGDYNDNGYVDAADYVVWRRSLTDQSPLPNEAASIGSTDEEDYSAWRENFGAMQAGNGVSLSASTTPEPTSFSILWAGILTVAVRSRLSRGLKKHRRHQEGLPISAGLFLF